MQLSSPGNPSKNSDNEKILAKIFEDCIDSSFSPLVRLPLVLSLVVKGALPIMVVDPLKVQSHTLTKKKITEQNPYFIYHLLKRILMKLD